MRQHTLFIKCFLIFFNMPSKTCCKHASPLRPVSASNTITSAHRPHTAWQFGIETLSSLSQAQEEQEEKYVLVIYELENNKKTQLALTPLTFEERKSFPLEVGVLVCVVALPSTSVQIQFMARCTGAQHPCIFP